MALGACRMLPAGLVLSLLTVRPSGLRTLRRPGVGRRLGVGVLVTAAFQVCFLQAVERGGAAPATAVAFGTVPVAGGLCARVLSGERPTPRGLWGSACAVAPYRDPAAPPTPPAPNRSRPASPWSPRPPRRSPRPAPCSRGRPATCGRAWACSTRTGARGLARQIAAAARWCRADRIDLVDVGGDIVARGDEPTLRSPLGDALAARAASGLPTTVHVAGPGLDNEVPLPDLLPRLGEPAFALDAAHTEAVSGVFDWHPSEASALLVAAARGVRGVCGTRDAPRPVLLDDTARQVHRLTLDRVLALGPLARALVDCASLEEAEDASRAVCGFSEIARERHRAAHPEQPPRNPAGRAPPGPAHRLPHGPLRRLGAERPGAGDRVRHHPPDHRGPGPDRPAGPDPADRSARGRSRAPRPPAVAAGRALTGPWCRGAGGG
ncbi:DUF1152 domain-containing protein [Streptomyces sp. NPDC096136]|uniref:DUF1152 domain-containing protein n=1 Tax=Streptomyces sp. NPDC096136 TaxID=3366076 RepID=UPI0038053293